MAARTSRPCDPFEPVACATRRQLGRGTTRPDGASREGRVSAWWWRCGCREGDRGRFAAGRLERATMIAVCVGAIGDSAVWFAGVVADGGARSTVFCFGAGDLTGAGSGAATPPDARSGPGAPTPPVDDPVAVAGAAVATHASSATIAAQLFSARLGEADALTMVQEVAPDPPRASVAE